MFPVNFDRSKMQRYLASLSNASPINDVRTLDDFAALAGACFFAMMSQGPVWKKAVAELTGKPYELPSHPEHREAQEHEIYDDLHAAIEYYGQLAMMVRDGNYDEFFEPNHKALVGIDDDGGKLVRPISGVRPQGTD